MALVNDGVHRQRFFSTGSTSGKSGSLCDVSRSDVQAQWNALDLPVVILLPGVEVAVVNLDPKAARTKLLGDFVGCGHRVHLQVLADHRANDDLEGAIFGGMIRPLSSPCIPTTAPKSRSDMP